jgi:hypothetical protein
LRLLTGSALAGVIGARPHDGTAAKKNTRKRKRRHARRRRRNQQQCLSLGTQCTTGAEPECCPGLRCDFPAALTMLTLCCGTAGQGCQNDGDCCQGFTCSPATGECVAI